VVARIILSVRSSHPPLPTFFVEKAGEKKGRLLPIPDAEGWYRMGKLSENGTLYNSFFTRYGKNALLPVLLCFSKAVLHSL